MSTDPQDSIVQVSSSEPKNKKFGTGFLIHRDDTGTYVLTCAHVLKDVGGPDHVRAGNKPAEVIVDGEVDGLDLAVLRVADLPDKEPLVLHIRGQTGHSITMAGYYDFGPYRAIRHIEGELGEQFAWDVLNQADRATVWDLIIRDTKNLERGYSGSPVLDAENVNIVLGVVVAKQGDQGAAISIAALELLWEHMPSSLLQPESEGLSQSNGSNEQANRSSDVGIVKWREENINIPDSWKGTWVIPDREGGSGESNEARTGIAKAWHKISHLWGEQNNIAFTGTYGVGKSVLYDHLTGKAFGPLYKPPPESRKLEEGYINSPIPTSRRIKMNVIPGQRSRQVSSVNKVFLGDVPVDGFVHVVANGFITLRNEDARETVMKKGYTTLDEYRRYHMQREIEDLQVTLNNVLQSMDRHGGKPSWMLIAATKADVYVDQLREAEYYYSPRGHSAFTDHIRAFEREVGSDKFTWDAIPVSAWLEHFEWNGESAKSDVIPLQRNRMLLNFVKVLEEYVNPPNE